MHHVLYLRLVVAYVGNVVYGRCHSQYSVHTKRWHPESLRKTTFERMVQSSLAGNQLLMSFSRASMEYDLGLSSGNPKARAHTSWVKAPKALDTPKITV